MMLLRVFTLPGLLLASHTQAGTGFPTRKVDPIDGQPCFGELIKERLALGQQVRATLAISAGALGTPTQAGISPE